MRRQNWFAVALCAAMTGLSGSGAVADVDGAVISATWRLVGNEPEGGFNAELTLRNEGDAELAGDWALYFNSASRLLPDSLPNNFTLTHINGDFFVLRPGKSLAPIPPGGSRIIPWRGEPWAINVSDAPSGFYLVFDDERDQPGTPIPVPLRIEPFPSAAELKRGPNDSVPAVSAESRYAENERLKLLPPDHLVKVVPTPAEVKPLAGRVALRSSTTLSTEPRLADEATLLVDGLEPLLGQRITVEPGDSTGPARPDSIRLRIKEVAVGGSIKRAGDEAYVLTIRPENGIEIVGSDPAGVFYGVQTLRALLPIESYRKPMDELTLDAVRIADAPRFRYRGLHLDVARNFQTKQTIKKLLDLMAFYKLNRLHWHLTDDEGWRIEIKNLPELTKIGGRRGHTLDETEHLVPSHGSGPDAASPAGSGFYTQEDLVDILRYAHARHIAVIPELDFPGHARAAVKAMEARHQRLAQRDPQAADEFLLREPGDESKYESVQMWRDNVVDVGREATYRFLNVVIGELAEVYDRAGVPLASIHLGGDEVPTGVWEKSDVAGLYEAASATFPGSQTSATSADSKIPRRGQLELHFLDRASEMLARRSIEPACWEDCLLLEVGEDASAGDTRRADGRPTPTAYVWNNVWGWGREDAAYRLANAGFDVVLCNATHLYFDLAYEKDPHEPGYYWAGFVGTRAPFELVPLDVFKNAHQNSMGQPVAEESFAAHARLTNKGRDHILGIQGQLWSENLRDAHSLEYMAFPKIIGLAERAWAIQPAWAEIADRQERQRQLEHDWNQFANRLGQRELPRLDYLSGGTRYRIPPPGAIARGGRVWANVAFPGLAIRFTTDGTEPTEFAKAYREPLIATGKIRLRTFDKRGRGSRTVTFVVPPGSAASLR